MNDIEDSNPIAESTDSAATQKIPLVPNTNNFLLTLIQNLTKICQIKDWERLNLCSSISKGDGSSATDILLWQLLGQVMLD